MTTTPDPISPAEMAVLIAHTLTTTLGLETETAEGVITFTTEATGQRFTLTVAEPGESSDRSEQVPSREALIAFARSIAAARPGENDEPSSEDQEYLTWAADDAERLLAEIPHQVPHQVPVTRKGSGFSVDLTAVRHAIANEATTLTFTAPEGWHFEDDRRLHPDIPEGGR